MSQYTQRAEIEAIIPPKFLVAILTDTGATGETPGLFDQIVTNAGNEVDSLLCAQYTVPFSLPPPAPVSAASRQFVLWALAERRAPGDKNPYAKNREFWQTKLKDVGEARVALDQNNRRFVGAAVWTCGVQARHWLNIADWQDSTSLTMNPYLWEMITEGRV